MARSVKTQGNPGEGEGIALLSISCMYASSGWDWVDGAHEAMVGVRWWAIGGSGEEKRVREERSREREHSILLRTGSFEAVRGDEPS